MARAAPASLTRPAVHQVRGQLSDRLNRTASGAVNIAGHVGNGRRYPVVPAACSSVRLARVRAGVRSFCVSKRSRG